MNNGPLLFLAAFFALASSWCGLVLAPQVQLGRMRQVNLAGTANTSYPLPRPGLAAQGLQVYRANGCAYCHSQQVGQTGMFMDVTVTDAGTNQAETVTTLLNLARTSTDHPNPLAALPPLELIGTNTAAAAVLTGLPKAFLRSPDPAVAKTAVKALNATGASAQIWVVPAGPDIARGWGRRRTVAADYLFDSPVMPGSQRVGPDLANIGTRLPDAKSHLLHLYAPQLQVKGSAMPPYRFLFVQRRIGRQQAPDALVLPAELAPPPGEEIVPTSQAKALAAYLLSLHADAPLFVAPMTVAATATAAPTNGPAGPDLTITNVAPAKAPAQ